MLLTRRISGQAPTMSYERLGSVVAVRSAILGRGVCNGGEITDLATVPDNETWIIRGVEASSAGIGTSTLQVYVEAADSSTRAVFLQQSLASLAVAHYSGWVVAGPTDVVRVNCSSVSAHVWVSGARLLGHVP